MNGEDAAAAIRALRMSKKRGGGGVNGPPAATSPAADRAAQEVEDLNRLLAAEAEKRTQRGPRASSKFGEEEMKFYREIINGDVAVSVPVSVPTRGPHRVAAPWPTTRPGRRGPQPRTRPTEEEDDDEDSWLASSDDDRAAQAVAPETDFDTAGYYGAEFKAQPVHGAKVALHPGPAQSDSDDDLDTVDASLRGGLRQPGVKKQQHPGVKKKKKTKQASYVSDFSGSDDEDLVPEDDDWEGADAGYLSDDHFGAQSQVQMTGLAARAPPLRRRASKKPVSATGAQGLSPGPRASAAESTTAVKAEYERRLNAALTELSQGTNVDRSTRDAQKLKRPAVARRALGKTPSTTEPRSTARALDVVPGQPIRIARGRRVRD